jgi:hypothetical protein
LFRLVECFNVPEIISRHATTAHLNGPSVIVTTCHHCPDGSIVLSTMAVARPVRFLGALSIVLVLFLLYQLWQPATTLVPPSHHDGDTIEHMESDPLLERMFPYAPTSSTLSDLV